MNSDVSNNFIKRVPTLNCNFTTLTLNNTVAYYLINFYIYHERSLSNQHCYFSLTLSKCRKKIAGSSNFDPIQWMTLNSNKLLHVHEFYITRDLHDSTNMQIQLHLVPLLNLQQSAITQYRKPVMAFPHAHVYDTRGKDRNMITVLNYTVLTETDGNLITVMSKSSGTNTGTVELLFHTMH